MLFLIRALSRLCRLYHFSLVPGWQTRCPFAACVTVSWDVSVLWDYFRGVTGLPRFLLFLWHTGTCNHLSTGTPSARYTCTKLPGPSAAVSAAAAAWAVTHPRLQKTLPCNSHHWELSGKINPPVYCAVSHIATIPATCRPHILPERAWAKRGRDALSRWGKQSCSPTPSLLAG